MMSDNEKLIEQARNWGQAQIIGGPLTTEGLIKNLVLALRDAEKAHAPEWEYTYMKPGFGYEDDYAGLPGSLEAAQEVAAEFPGKGVIHKRPASGPWVPIEQDGA